MRALLFGLLLVPLASVAQTASFEILPEGYISASPDGSALIVRLVDGTFRYGVWQDGEVTSIIEPRCTPTSSFPTVLAFAVSNEGVASWAERDGADYFLWDGSTCYTMSDLIPESTFITRISPDGRSAVGAYRIPPPDPTQGPTTGQYIWNEGAVTLLPTPAEGGRGELVVSRLSDDGSTVAGSESVTVFEPQQTTTTTYFLQRNGTRTAVPHRFSTPNDDFVVFEDLSPDGSIALVREQTGTATEDLRYTPYTLQGGRATLIPAPPDVPADALINAVALSADGSRILGYASWRSVPVTVEPILWDNLVPRRVVDLLTEQGVDPSTFPDARLTPRFISDDGRVLIGTSSGTTWRATLAQSASWAEAASGFFDDPDRWAPARVPDATTLTRLAATGGDYTVTLRDDQTLPSLSVAVTPENTAPTVTLDLDGRTLTLAPQSDALDALVVGDQGDGTLFLLDGVVDANGGVTLGRAGSAQGRLFSDVTFQIDGPLVVGDGAAGTDETASTLGIIDGTTTAALGFDVGLQAGTNGFIAVESGATLQVPADAPSTIGFAGTGQVIVTEGFLSHTGPLTLGRLATGQGTLNLRSGATALTTDSLVVGLAGIGELEIVGGSGLSTGPAVLGSREGSVASVRLAGAGSEWDIAGDLLNGLDGAAVLEVVEGASLCVSGLALTGAQGRFVSDDTIVLGFADCASNVQDGHSAERRGANGGIALAGLTVAAGGEVVAPAIEVGPGGVLDGAGALAVPVTNGGTLAPGGPDALGTLALTADLTQTAGAVLALEVGTDGADALTVDSAVTLGGTLRVAALPGSTPMVGASYDVLTASSLSGTFERIETPEGLSVSVGAAAVTVSVVGVVSNEEAANEDEALPTALALRAYPNPLATRATLAYDVPEAGPVHLVLYDVLGRAVATVAEGVHAAGRHEARLDAASLPSGAYVARLEAGGVALTRRLTVVR
ncbi:MAG: T9SS type A sorting domain-containing protein [Bacteroidota bacterium]